MTAKRIVASVSLPLLSMNPRRAAVTERADGVVVRPSFTEGAR